MGRADWRGRPASDDSQRDRYRHSHDAHPVAVHGAAAVQRDENHTAELHARCAVTRRDTHHRISTRLFAQHDSRHRRGGILVFIISIGYYITPALVGGVSGTFISNFIAYHISTSLNWGLGAALGAILLAMILALYILYDKVVGIDNMKLG